jgi:hypothetical protein
MHESLAEGVIQEKPIKTLTLIDYVTETISVRHVRVDQVSPLAAIYAPGWGLCLSG